MNLYTYRKKLDTFWPQKCKCHFLQKQKRLIYKNFKKLRNLLKILGIIKMKLKIIFYNSNLPEKICWKNLELLKLKIIIKREIYVN
jgi:hypothetical protein